MNKVIKKANLAITILLLTTTANADIFMDETWAKKSCDAWNNNSALTSQLYKYTTDKDSSFYLGSWVKKNDNRGYRIIQMYRTICGAATTIQLNIAEKNGKAMCVYGGAPDGKAINSSVDYIMHASDKDWACMGKGTFGCQGMGALATGKLKFKGPKLELMKILEPFEAFLKLAGKLPGDTASCPAKNPEVIKTSIEDLYLDVLSKDGMLLKFASDKLKSNKYIVDRAVTENGLSLEYAHNTLKNNKDTVLKAVMDNGLAHKFASKEMQYDESILKAALVQNPASIDKIEDFIKVDKSLSGMDKVSEILDLQAAEASKKVTLGNKEMTLGVVNLTFQLDNINKDTMRIITTAAEKYSDILSHLDSEVINKDNIIILAKINGNIISHAEKKYLNDPDIITTAVSQKAKYFKFSSDNIKKDKNLLLQFIHNDPFILIYADESLKKDEGFLAEVDKIDKSARKYLSISNK